MIIAMKHPIHGYAHVYTDVEATALEAKEWKRLDTSKDGDYTPDDYIDVPVHSASVLVEPMKRKRGRPRKHT